MLLYAAKDVNSGYSSQLYSPPASHNEVHASPLAMGCNCAAVATALPRTAEIWI